MLKLHAAMLAAALVLALTAAHIAFPPYFTWKVASWWTAMALIAGGVVALYAIHFPALCAIVRKFHVMAIGKRTPVRLENIRMWKTP